MPRHASSRSAEFFPHQHVAPQPSLLVFMALSRSMTTANDGLPESEYRIWVDPHGYFWIDTSDETTHPFRVTRADEADEWHTLEDALNANLTALVPAT